MLELFLAKAIFKAYNFYANVPNTGITLFYTFGKAFLPI
jgi:hypothetical protein